jgi:hypothetical protein
MLVYFDEDETIIENLARLIPSAIQRGFLPAECSADSVKLLYGGRQLNLNVSFDKQTFSVPERSILNIQDRSSTIKVRIHYTPDNFGERSDTVFINPNKILSAELAKFLSGVSKEYKFYRRKAKKFNLIKDRSKVKLNKTLAVQQIESGFDATLAPRLFFRWPPGKLAIGTFVTAFALIAAVVVWRLWLILFPTPPPVIERFYVTINTDIEANLVNPDTSIAMLPDSALMLILEPGRHDFEVFPKQFPIFPFMMTLAADAANDSMTFFINVQSRFADVEPISLIVTGYRGREFAGNRIEEPLLVNGYPQAADEFGAIRFSIPRGVYVLKYDLDDDLFEEDRLEYDHSTIYRSEKFRFDFSKCPEGEAIQFFYSPSK